MSIQVVMELVGGYPFEDNILLRCLRKGNPEPKLVGSHQGMMN